MAKSRSLHQAVRFALATATAAAGVTTLHAQEAPAPAAAPVEEVVVTGSRLKTPNETSISPITSVAATDIQATGLTRIEDVLNNLPMVFAGMNSTTSNGADGTATIDLRGLGNQRTLVLVNGRRLGPGTGDGRNFSDINQIPTSLIERVDIETGGASSVYGADAVAGVVNFVLDTNFQGVKVDAGYNFFQHNNHQDALNGLVSAAGDTPAPSSFTGGYAKNVSVIMGSNFADDKGNATMYATFDTQAAVTQSHYDYGACSLGVATKTSLACLGSPVGPNGNILGYDSAYNPLFDYAVDPKTGALRNFNESTDTFNYGPYNFYQRPNERWTAGGFLHYDVNSHVQTYAEVMFSRNQTTAQIAPAGSFGEQSAFIPCADPLLTPQQSALLCSPANLAAQGNPTQTFQGKTYPGVNLYFLRRNVEGGGRLATFTSDAARIVLGVKGDINDVWSYDVYAQRGTVDGQNTNQGYFNIGNITNALEVFPDASGAPVCAVGNPCVPYNVWKPGGVTAAALAYLYVPQLIELTTTEQVVSGSVTGDLGKYGLKLPTAASGVQFNVGAEWRQESAQFSPDEVTQTGNASGLGGSSPPVAGQFHVKEVFTEARIPLLDNMPLAQNLAFEGGYRYSKYSEGFTTNTYKLGLEWSPVQDIRARASYQRAVRAPNIAELYAPQALGLDGSIDPCSGATPQATAAQCALTGVTAAQYGHINPNSSNQYNGFLGGNPNLQPETSDTYSAGLQFTPHMIPNLSFSADYFNIKVTDVIGPVGANAIISNCLATGNAGTCALVHRAPSGSLWLGTQGYIIDTNVNLGALSTRGIDFKGSYRIPLRTLGSFQVQFEGTLLNALTTEPIVGAGSYDCVGYFGVQCGAANPSWRHVMNFTWSTPWDGLDVVARWRYIGADKSEGSNPSQLLNSSAPADGAPYAGTERIPAYNYFDLSATFNLVKNVRLQLGVNNIADKDPPIVVGSDCSTSSPGGANCNGNTFPGAYDSMGRFFFAHITAQF